MHVIATAGHVDHGKSRLVRALTGMEPDRWAEERRRGMTIDLGYAWTRLPSGSQLAFVDVPGHQRFIGNMLAGLGPAPAVLFVVAADEGWSQQSDEHLAAINALHLHHGLLAVTKSDLADPAPVVQQSLERIGGSILGPVPAVAVSGATGQGLDVLRSELVRLTSELPLPDADARVRLWVDRSFTIRGAGTVVTGTLGAGSIQLGDTLQIGDSMASVRGLQLLGEPARRVTAVSRVAVNLRGVAHGQIGRGDALLTPGAWIRTATVDVRLYDPAGSDAKLAGDLMLHVGTATVAARLRRLDGMHGRLTLAEALPLSIGDRGILRDTGRQRIAAGALVLDPDPKAFDRRGAAARQAERLRNAPDRPDPYAEVIYRGPVQPRRLAALGVSPQPLSGEVRDVAGWLIAEPTWLAWLDRLTVELDRWASKHPMDPQMPADALAQALELPDRDVIGPLLAAAGLTPRNGRVATSATMAATLPPAAETAVVEVERRLASDPFAAPERHELTALGLGRSQLAAAEGAGRLVRLADDVVLLPAAIEEAVRLLRALPAGFTVSEARQALATTRRVALPLLEYLDRRGLTRRMDASHRTMT